MAIATLALPNVFAPLQSLLAWWSALRHRAQQAAAQPTAPRARAPHTLPHQPLRVLRVVEPRSTRTAAGRMVISGRMADVCAELERLAAQEERAAASPSQASQGVQDVRPPTR
jgi:hypothetical protein